MHAPSRTWAPAGLLAALALITAGACGSSAVAPSTSPVVVAAAPSATAAPSSTSATTTPPAQASAAIADADPIPEGDYTTGPMTVEMMAAAVEAHGLDPDVARSFADNEGFKIHEVMTMRLKDGNLTLLQSLDGGTPTVGWDGTYAFADDATMIAEADGYPITYSIRWEDDSLHLQVLKDTHPDAVDLVAQVALYEIVDIHRGALIPASSSGCMALCPEMVTQSAGPATRSVVAPASGGTQWRVPMSIDDSRAAPREAEAALDYASLFLLEYPAVVRTVSLMLRDNARAEEIAQDAFVQLHLAWAKVSRYERPGAWVRRNRDPARHAGHPAGSPLGARRSRARPA